MKKSLFIALTFLGFQTAVNAQISKNVGDFTSVKTTNKIKVELIPATENKIVVKESDENSISITNKNGRLILKNTLKELVTENEYSVTVQVHYKNLEEIDAQGGSYIFSTQPITQSKLNLQAGLGATIVITVKTQDLDISANTGAKVKVDGTNENATKISSSAGSTVTAKDILTKRTKVSVNAGGHALVAATDYLETQIIGGGTIKVFGKPKEVKEKKSIGGTIEYVK